MSVGAGRARTSALRDLDLEQVTQTFLNFKLLICEVGMESPLLGVLVCLG